MSEREAREGWIKAGEAAASLAEDEGRAVEVGEEPTYDTLTVGADDSLTVEDRRAAWREGWDSYAEAIASAGVEDDA